MLTCNDSGSVGLVDFSSYDVLVDSVAEVLEVSRDEVWTRLLDEAVQVGTNVTRAARVHGVRAHVYDDSMRTFYTDTDAFVYELIVSHLRPYSQLVDTRVVECLTANVDPGSRVLCLGDGIGSDTIRFSGLGFDISYFEFDGASARFAKHRLLRAGLDDKVACMHRLDEIPTGEYDAVICREVLEHVPSPTRVITDIWEYLKHGGVAVVTESFDRIEQQFPTHLESNRKYAGKTPVLFVDAGFTFLKSYPAQRPQVFQKTRKDDRSRFRSLSREAPVAKLLKRFRSFAGW